MDFIKNIAYDVFAASPEMPEMFICAPSGPNRNLAFIFTGRVISSGVPAYTVSEPQTIGFWTLSRPSARIISSGEARYTGESFLTGV